jgi:hypothetical protein
MQKRAYRVMATEADGTIKVRDFIDITKAQATAQRWSRVPVFTDVKIVPSLPVVFLYDQEVPLDGTA